MTSQPQPTPEAISVSRETEDRLRLYSDLVRKWSPRINLVARSTLDDLWQRHILDSVQVYSAAERTAGKWVDMGSGAGFPGAVVAILAAAEAPAIKVTLVESDQRKATFLRAVSRETFCPFDVVSERIEQMPPAEADILSARALAPMSRLLEFTARHLRASGVALYPKGATHEAEMIEARQQWRFEQECIQSRTDPKAVLYRIRKVHRV
jgi:16S rRNA (guanine527-N7)-methyltransferase